MVVGGGGALGQGEQERKHSATGLKAHWYGWNCLGVSIGFPTWGARLSLAYGDSGLASL